MAKKQRCPFGPEYHILLSELDQWKAARPGREKDEEGLDQCSEQGESPGNEHLDQGVYTLSKETWEVAQGQMQALAYRAGQAEGQLKILRE